MKICQCYITSIISFVNMMPRNRVSFTKRFLVVAAFIGLFKAGKSLCNGFFLAREFPLAYKLYFLFSFYNLPSFLS